MKWQQVGGMQCSVARTLSVIGDRWTMLVVRNLFMGIRRFDDFQSSLGVTRHVLTERLNRLVEEGVVRKEPYQNNPPRHEYRLTDSGKDLYPILLALTAWGDKWKDEGGGPPLHYRHLGCDHVFTPVMTCSACHEPVLPQDVVAEPGPGLLAGAADQAARGG